MRRSRAPAFRQIRLTARRVLTATPVFDTYWRFAVRRQDLFFRRVAGTPPPWTNDPVLVRYRFTNPYRAADRVSQYLIRKVLYAGEQTPQEVFFRAILFKLFNRINTWEVLEAELGWPSWKRFDFDRYARVLDAMMARGQRVYSAAYIMPSPRLGNRRKHRNHLRLLEYMMRAGAPAVVARAGSLREVFEAIRRYQSLGAFLAFQFAIDLNYSEVIHFSEMDFVVAGPGARDGIRKCFADIGGLDEAELIRAVSEMVAAECERLGLSFKTLWGRPLQLVDCQNLFCEVAKYARVVHPEARGALGRTRIKQVFAASHEPLPQWYPPKWGITVPLPVNSGSMQPSPGRRTARGGSIRQAGSLGRAERCDV